MPVGICVFIIGGTAIAPPGILGTTGIPPGIWAIKFPCNNAAFGPKCLDMSICACLGVIMMFVPMFVAIRGAIGTALEMIFGAIDTCGVVTLFTVVTIAELPGGTPDNFGLPTRFITLFRRTVVCCC